MKQADKGIEESPLIREVVDKHYKDMEKMAISTTDDEPKGVFIGHDAPETAKDRIIEALETQERKGLEKYGKTVDDATLPIVGWTQHLREELVDALFYLDRIEQKIKGL